MTKAVTPHTVFEDSFSEEVWRSTYKDHSDETIDDTFRRIAKAVASPERTEELKKEWEEKFYDMLSEFKCTAGGRIYANAGTEFGGTTMMNCYVSPRDNYDIDSLPGIIKDVLNQCQTLKSEGGWGQNFSWIRPRGAFIHGIGVETPGAVKYMEIYDKTSDVITSGSGKKSANKKAKGKIRKGAMMGVLDCVGGNTPINTLSGKVPIKDLVGQKPYLYCTDGQGSVYVRQALLVWSKGVRKTIKVVFDNDDFIECTPEHEFMLSNGSFKKAKDLQANDSLAALNKRLINDYLSLSVSGSRKTIAEHNAVYEMKYGEYPTILSNKRKFDSTVAHHVDHVKWNNHPDNIQHMTLQEHAIHHSEQLREMQAERATRMRGTTWEEFYGEDKANNIRKKYVSKRKGSTPWNKGMKFSVDHTNHKVVRVEESIEQEVFDISMPDYHNFVANGVFIHNCWHPDIEEFIRAKQQPGRLTKFNVSVNCTDEFMTKVITVLKATEAGASETDVEILDQWNLRFPDTTHEKYKTDWDGNLRKWESKGYPTKIYRTISALGLWNLIMESTYNRAEPGVLFLDRANYYGPLNYLETIFATNPSMPAGTLVHTDGGIVPIETLEGKNFKVKSLDGVWADAVCRLSGENEELLEISLGENRSIKSTKEHRWPVYDTRMKRIYKAYAHELKTGDLIPLNRNEAFGVPSSNLSFDEGFLVGYIVGDGWFSNKGDGTYNVGITFGPTERVMAERVLNIINNLKSIPSTITEKETGELCIQFSTKQLTEKMIDRYGLTPGVKEIPSSVWTGSEQYIKGFVDGLLSSDGNVFFDKNNQRVVLTTSRENLAQQFGKLLGFAGVPVSIWHRSTTSTFPNGKDYEKTFERWDVAVHGKALVNFFNVFSVSHPDKLQILEQAISYVVENKRDNLQQRFAKVVSVKQVGTAKVWDISVAHNQHVFPTEWCYTGNCGEQTLAPGGVCNLGSINLTQFINEDRTGFDLERIKIYTRYLNRFLDNINSISHAPLPEYEDSMKNKRRIGIGVLGWGSALFMLKVRFGSEQAEKLRTDLMETISKEAYMSSIDLAVEKGMFEYCIPHKHVEGAFVKDLKLPQKYIDKLRITGIRNSSLLSIQPTGNTSIFANVVSGGLEPVFMPEYIRTVIVNTMPDEIADVCPKWYEGEWKETEMFKLAKEGDEEILRGEYNGTVYKIDKNRGLTKEVLCQDYGVRWLSNRGEWDPNANWAATTLNLSVQDHVEDLKGFARYVDSAISKTVNVPFDYPFEDFKNIYLESYKSGYIKGITTYRSGTMTTVLSAKEEKEGYEEEIILEDAKIPAQSPATMNTIRAEGKKWYVTVVMDEEQKRPVAFFVHTNNHEKTATTNDAVDRLIDLAKEKGIPQKWIESTLEKIEKDNNVTKVARCISLNLRHGVLIKNVVAALDNVDGAYVGTFVFQIKKYLMSWIKDGEKVENGHCPECGSSNFIYSEGCIKCGDCGYSKCG